MLVIAQAVVRQRFDNSALANLSGTAFSYYATQLSLHALQATNTLLNPSQVLARQHRDRWPFPAGCGYQRD